MEGDRSGRRSRALPVAAVVAAAVVVTAAVVLRPWDEQYEVVDADGATGWIEVPDPDTDQRGAPEAPAPDPTEQDVAYVPDAQPGCQGPDVDAACSGSQTLDIYRASGDGSHPVVLWFHGGGWVAGDKNNLSDPVLHLHHQGFDIVSVNYRLSAGPEPARFPAAVQDAKAAVRWVKANAESHRFDREEIVAMGGSAGGYLVQMLATTAGEPGLEPETVSGAQEQQGSGVAAAVSFAGVCDMCSLLVDGDGWSAALLDALLGCSTDCSREVLAEASPTTHVSDDSAPLYAVTGADDALAPPAVADLLGRAYERAGIGHRFFDDAVDTGDPSCRGHNPWCGTNAAALDRFVDDVRDG